MTTKATVHILAGLVPIRRQLPKTLPTRTTTHTNVLDWIRDGAHVPPAGD